MNEGIQPKPLHEVGPIFAGYLGLNWVRDRNRVVQLINELRDMLHIDPDIPNIYSHKAFCIKPTTWRIDCADSCQNKVKGFVLPEELENILQAWVDYEPIDNLHSKWWEGRQIRITDTNSGQQRVVATGEYSSTQRPIKTATYLHFYSDGNEGKRIYLKIRDLDGDIVSYVVTLREHEVVTTEEPVVSIESINIPKLDGHTVKVFDDDDNELSTYNGRISLPRYPIYKVVVPCEKSVFIQGSQRYIPLCYDDEIVEIGSLVILKEAAKMLRYGDEGTDTKELAIADRYELRLKKMIRGAIKRQMGSNISDGNILTGEPYLNGMPRLKGY